MTLMTAGSVDELVRRTVALSQSWRRAANALLDEAHARFDAGKMSQADFNRVFADYLSMVGKAMDVNNAATHQLAEGASAVLDAVEKDTQALCQKFDRLKATENLIAVSLKWLVAIGAVALAMLAPSPASAAAAAAAVGDALQTVLSK
jgi:hypothetical protein